MPRPSAARRITALTVTAALSSPALAQPNNTCGTATFLPIGGSVSGTTNLLTTTDGASSCGGSRDVWHFVNVECTGNLTLYTCPAPFDTVISVHTGCPGSVANEIACNDDSGYCGTAYPLASAVTLPVTPGTYYIRVAGFGGAFGDYTLNAVLDATTPGNNDCANAVPIGDGAYAGCTSAATPDGSAACGGSNGNADVWYSYTATCDGTLDVYTCPVGYDTVLSVHTGCPGSTANQIACNDDSAYCGAAYPLASYVPVQVVTGNTYLIRVSGFAGATGPFVLNTHLSNPSAPSNDACASARPITDGAYNGSTICATMDGSADCRVTTSPDTWFRYTPTCNGTLNLYTCPASYDTLISVHSGCPGTPANQLACNDDSAYCGAAYPLTSFVSLPVVSGTPYLVRVSGFNGLRGTFVLNAALSCCYPNCDGSTTPPVLNVLDFNCFLNRFSAGNAYANCDNSTTPPVLNVLDFNCFLNRFSAGCP
jgi:hypothetical protein